MTRFETAQGDVVELQAAFRSDDPAEMGVTLVLVEHPGVPEVFLDRDTAIAIGLALTHGRF